MHWSREVGRFQYVDSWMKRPGDLGIVAIEDKTQIGAAWIRKWIGSDQGCGFVDTAIPELSISLHSEYRGIGIGIGTKLLGLLLEKVSQQYEAVSLSVANYNPGKVLYVGI